MKEAIEELIKKYKHYVHVANNNAKSLGAIGSDRGQEVYEVNADTLNYVITDLTNLLKSAE